MIFYKAQSSDAESGLAFQTVDPSGFTPEEQRRYVTLALHQLSGVSMEFDHTDAELLHSAGLFSGIAPDDIQPGSAGRTEINPEQVDMIGTTLRTFKSKRTAENESGTCVLLKILTTDRELLAEIRIEPGYFQKIIEETLLKPLDREPEK
jgi:hypothetical protein